MNFQDLVLKLSNFWSEKGCLLVTSHNTEVGAGTMNPATFLRVLGPEPWKAAYVEPSRRPKDGRYGDNPNRVQQFNQYQVILKPSPEDVVPVFIESLEALGIDPGRHDIRFIEDDWEAPTLGAFGLGWEVWLDGMEITQFTYFQQAGGLTLDPVSTEITYGLERICMYIQGVDNIMDIRWGPGVKYGEIYRQPERDFSSFNFEEADTEMYFDIFSRYRVQAERMLEKALVFPAYDYVLKCSHIFNVLDARGAISVSERTNYISNIRDLARRTAQVYIEKREAEGFPLMQDQKQ